MKESQDTNKGSVLKWILKNILLAAAFVVALVIVINMLLGIFTNHGKSVTVPDLTSLSVTEAAREAGKLSLKVEVTDSIYVRRMAKGAVYSQNPKAGSQVKKGRRILLTINALHAKKVTMPNLVGYSMRQAKAELNSRGLTLGKLTYVSDMATNNVLRQVHKNREIKPGSQIESGSVIDLVVGLNSTDNQTYVPDLKGMKYLRAVDAIHDNSLNVRKLNFDSNVRTYSDSLNAVVYRQSPTPSDAPIMMGSEVSVYLSLDSKDSNNQ
ncbi:MAG: PASTA domain-containing protein [Candidatus Cryptobacteroides sp.]